MGLGIPADEIDDVVTAVDPRLVVVGVGLVRVAKQLAVPRPAVEAVGFLQRMSRFVPKDAPALRLASAFALEHLRALQSHQAGVREVERHGKTQHPIGGEELLRQPDMRAGDDVTCCELAIEARDAARHQRILEPHRQIAQPQSQQRLVGSVLQVDPCVSAGATSCACGHCKSLGNRVVVWMRGQRCG